MEHFKKQPFKETEVLGDLYIDLQGEQFIILVLVPLVLRIERNKQ